MILSRSFHKYTAFFLLLIFSAVQVIQCLHHHAEENHAAFSVKDDHHSSGAQFHIADVKCELCDYLRDHQPRCFFPKQPPFDVVFNIPPRTPSASFTESLFERAVHTWTNKGPPVS